MKDQTLLQPLLDYIRPAHASLFGLLPGPILLTVAVFLSGQDFPPILIGFMIAAAVFATLGHFLQRYSGNQSVLAAAQRHGEAKLAEDFRAARSLVGDQLRLGRMMLYSGFCQELWTLRDLDCVRFSQSTDSDGDKCFELWCVLRSGGAVRICYSSNAADEPMLKNACDLINQCISAPEGSLP